MHRLVSVATIIFLCNVITALPRPSNPELVIAAEPLTKCCDEICSVAFSPDGAIVATKLYHSGFLGSQGIVLWDVTRGSLIKGIEGPPEGVYSISFGPDGQTIGSSYGQIWNLHSGKALTLGAPGDNIFSIAFSPDGSLIASGSGRYADKMTLWDAETGNPIRVFKSDARTGNVTQFSRDGKTLMSAGPDFVQLWSIESGRVMRTIRPGCGEYGLSAYRNGASVLVVTDCGEEGADHTIEILDADTGRLVKQFDGHSSAIWSIDLSPDARLVASTGGDLRIKLWDIATGTLLQSLTGHSKIVRSVVFSPDGRTIASGGGDNETKLWSVPAGKLLVTLKTFNDGNWVAYTPDGYYNRSPGASRYISWRVDNAVYGEATYKDRFLRPEIVAARLQEKR